MGRADQHRVCPDAGYLEPSPSDRRGASRGTHSSSGELRRLHREALRSRVLEVELGVAGQLGWASYAEATTGSLGLVTSEHTTPTRQYRKRGRCEGPRTEVSKLCS